MSVNATTLDTTLDTIRFCNLCNKPISTESAYKRHVAYCRRTQDRPKKRRRSCRECHSAKAKCSFETECARCKARGLDCVYEAPHTPSGVVSTNTSSWCHSVSGSSGDYSNVPYNSLTYPFGSSTSLELPATSPRSLTELRADPIARHSAKFILETMRGLPLTMLDRESFSWYCHGYWFLPELPRDIAKCSAIANLYNKRQGSEKESVWSMIDEENRELLRILPSCPFNDLATSMRAQIIYMLMYALDNNVSSEVPEIRLQMLMTFNFYGQRASGFDAMVWFPVSDLDNPDVAWEDWVYIESRRRCALTWFLLSRVIDLKFGVMCPTISNYRALPLPCSQSLWSAKTRSEWENARISHLKQYKSSLRTFGDLIDARLSPDNSERGRDLNRWYANCDKLGLLLALATTMV
ncbi:uncharacterized protein F4812DRAFT_469937 [Daldinia caldariorum]|uniref:uncharacterized protein n=1 Tax=Daldinia caldariorum TaxID=326644 RepID=UPI002008A1F9|nr:uncharacterized protein F4812DRAFT_469937 [Daldinia caldariorum]KAI1469905.1 hypothetical protein F4812DRAFT_469937 [Daldinia caldariorum]